MKTNEENPKIDEINEMTSLKGDYVFRSKIQNNPELLKLKNEILEQGTDITDENSEEFRNRIFLEKLGHRLYNYGAFLEHYIHAFLSMAIAIYLIYYTNIFYHIYFNPKVIRFNLYISCLFFVLVLVGFSYLSIYCPYKYTQEQVDKEYNNVIPYCTVLGIIAFYFLISALWPIYSWTSIPMFCCIFWGLVMSANVVNKGAIGNIFFLTEFGLMLFSYKFINGPGHTYI